MRNVRTEIRSILVMLGGRSELADSQDVFATSFIRSMNLIELICSLEDTFGIEITQRDVFDGNLRSVDRLCAFLVERRPELARCA